MELNELILPGDRFRALKDPSFRFEPGPHLSYFQEKILWSITGALKQAGLINTDYYTLEARIRGTHVHEACHYLDEGDLDWDHFEKFRPDIVGYIRAWEAFKRDRKFVPRLIELPMYDPFLLFAGIPDREGLLDGEPAIVEIKSGTLMRWTAYQTAGQELLLNAWENPKVPVFRRRIGVALQKDGTYRKPVEFEDPHDFDVFRAALTVSQAAGGIDRGVPPLELAA